MPRISEEHRQAMTLRIEEAAMECARTKGLAAMSMADIISESGLSAGAIYGYYKGKDELLAALARRVVSGRIAVLDQLSARTPVPHPGEGVLEFMDLAAGSLRDGGLVVQVWAMSANSPAIGDIAGGSYARLSTHLSSYVARWYQEARELSPEAAAQAAATITPAVLALIQGWLFLPLLADGGSDDSYRASVAALLGHL